MTQHLDAYSYAKHNRPACDSFTEQFLSEVRDVISKGLGGCPEEISEENFIKNLWNYACSHVAGRESLEYEDGKVIFYVNCADGQRGLWTRYLLDSYSVLFSEVGYRIGKLFGVDCFGVFWEWSEHLKKCREDIRSSFQNIKDELFR